MLLAAVGLVLALAVPVEPTPGPTPAPPEVEREYWRQLLQWPEACEAGHQSAVRFLELREARVRVFDLGGRRRLVQVGCAHGSYQDRLLFYLYDESRTPAQVTPLTLPTYEALDDEWQAGEVSEAAGETSFDAARRTLTLFTRARGLGDCGGIARYRVQATRLVLVEFRGRLCDGDPESAPPPERWPRVFPK